jgi:hypothetical protein
MLAKIQSGLSPVRHMTHTGRICFDDAIQAQLPLRF